MMIRMYRTILELKIGFYYYDSYILIVAYIKGGNGYEIKNIIEE